MLLLLRYFLGKWSVRWKWNSFTLPPTTSASSSTIPLCCDLFFYRKTLLRMGVSRNHCTPSHVRMSIYFQVDHLGFPVDSIMTPSPKSKVKKENQDQGKHEPFFRVFFNKLFKNNLESIQLKHLLKTFWTISLPSWKTPYWQTNNNIWHSKNYYYPLTTYVNHDSLIQFWHST